MAEQQEQVTAQVDSQAEDVCKLKTPVVEEAQKVDAEKPAEESNANGHAKVTNGHDKSDVTSESELKSENKVEPAVEKIDEKCQAEKVDSEETKHSEEGEKDEEFEEAADKLEDASKEEVSADAKLDETCKRKAENDTAVEEEKTPKKAKTVEEDGDQVPVEETAA